MGGAAALQVSSSGSLNGAGSVLWVSRSWTAAAWLWGAELALGGVASHLRLTETVLVEEGAFQSGCGAGALCCCLAVCQCGLNAPSIPHSPQSREGGGLSEGRSS